MKRATIIVTVIAAGLLSVALAAQTSPAPAEPAPGTGLYNQVCPQNQGAYQQPPMRQGFGQMNRQGRGVGRASGGRMGRAMGGGVGRGRDQQAWPQNQGEYQQPPMRQGLGQMNGQGRGMGRASGGGMGRAMGSSMRRGRDQQAWQTQSCSRLSSGFGRGRQQCVTTGANVGRQGRGRQGQALGRGRGRQRQFRTAMDGGCRRCRCGGGCR